MTKQGVGLALFGLGVIWTFFWGIAASLHQNELFAQVLTFEEYEQTIWASTGSLTAIWGFAPPLGAIIGGVGLLLHSGAKGSISWKFGIAILLAVIATFVIGSLGHFPPLYAIGGTLIFLSFFGILWLWAKERRTLKGRLAAAADLKLAGYVFILVGIWFACGIAGPQWIKAFSDQPPMMEPLMVQIFFVLGLGFLFLGHYKSQKRLA